jgi:hypothetical protein
MKELEYYPSGGPETAISPSLRSEGTPAPRCVDDIEEAFVRAHALERREPGGRKWPFAGDGPWHLIQAEVGDMAGDWSETLIETEAGKQLSVRKIDVREPRPPLGAAEVAELAQLRAWLMLVPESDRKLVWIATARLHAGEGRVPWKALTRWLRIPRTPDAVARRYRLALALAVCAINGWPTRRAQAMAR